MLTGDTRASAEAIAREVGIAEAPRQPAPGRQARSHPRISVATPPCRHGWRRHQRCRRARAVRRWFRHGSGHGPGPRGRRRPSAPLRPRPHSQKLSALAAVRYALCAGISAGALTTLSGSPSLRERSICVPHPAEPGARQHRHGVQFGQRARQFASLTFQLGARAQYTAGIAHDTLEFGRQISRAHLHPLHSSRGRRLRRVKWRSLAPSSCSSATCCRYMSSAACAVLPIRSILLRLIG